MDCNLKYAQAEELERQGHQAELNHLADFMESSSGVSGVIPRYGNPPPPVHTGPVTFNNIRVDRSIVGAINQGVINHGVMEKLDVVMTNVRNYGEGGRKISEALKELTQAVVDTKELQAATKNEIIEDLDFLLEHIEKNQTGPFRAILDKLNSIFGSLTNLATLWAALKAALGLG